MELKNGYKKTEVGYIPTDWGIQRIIDCADYVDYRGKTPHKTSSGRFLVTAKNIKNGFIDYNISQEFVSEDEYENIMRRGKAQVSDILVTTEAPLGNVACVDDDTVALAQRVIKYRPKETVVIKTYLKYYFLFDHFQKILNDNSSGSTAKGIKGSILHKLPVVIPPLSEQKAIATVLSDTDALITSLQKLIEKKRNIKQGAMQELLTGKKRLPGFEKQKGYRETEVGTIPMDWDVKKLGEIGECIIGLTYKPENVKNSGTLVLRSSNIGNNVLVFDDNVYVDVDIPEKLVTKQGDILICVRNGSRDLIGKCALITEKAKGETFGAFMSIYRTQFYNYVFHQFTSYCIYSQIRQNIGATINQITNKNLNSFAIPFPTISEQTAIASVLSDMDSEIEALEKKLNKYRAIKQGMMQVLLTGKIRLLDN